MPRPVSRVIHPKFAREIDRISHLAAYVTWNPYQQFKLAEFWYRQNRNKPVRGLWRSGGDSTIGMEKDGVWMLLRGRARS